jgi:hypothetical protein
MTLLAGLNENTVPDGRGARSKTRHSEPTALAGLRTHPPDDAGALAALTEEQEARWMPTDRQLVLPSTAGPTPYPRGSCGIP